MPPLALPPALPPAPLAAEARDELLSAEQQKHLLQLAAALSAELQRRDAAAAEAPAPATPSSSPRPSARPGASRGEALRKIAKELQDAMMVGSEGEEDEDELR
jgi:nucleotide-binding universal stress UspA family protein